MIKQFLTLSVFSILGLAGCSGSDDLYALNLGYGSGGYLGGSKVIITVNGHRLDFFGEDHSTVSAISGTDMSYISDFVKQGENTIGLEIVPSGDVSEDKKKEDFKFTLAIEHLKKGDAVVTGQGNVFEYSVTLKPGDPTLKWEKTFVVPAGK